MLPPAEREALFSETAAQLGVSSSVIVEKDFWVCFTLKHLFGLDFRPTLLLKGGTSLSKAFGLIQRFSEDIDLTLNRAELGFEGASDPLEIQGTNARRRGIKALAEKCRSVVAGELAPALRASFEGVLGRDGWSLEIVNRDDGQSDLNFHYPPSLTSAEYGGIDYIKPLVRLEIGARSDRDPVQEVEIRSYAAEYFPDYFVTPTVAVRVLSPERTFWEKATILHSENNRPTGRPRPGSLSRHAYDIVMLERGGIATLALEQPDLLAAVVRHKNAFFGSGWSDYDQAVPGTFQLVPRGEFEAAIRQDYEKMSPMFFDEVPSFDDLLATLEELEARINAA